MSYIDYYLNIKHYCRISWFSSACKDLGSLLTIRKKLKKKTKNKKQRLFLGSSENWGHSENDRLQRESVNAESQSWDQLSWSTAGWRHKTVRALTLMKCCRWGGLAWRRETWGAGGGLCTCRGPRSSNPSRQM